MNPIITSSFIEKTTKDYDIQLNPNTSSLLSKYVEYKLRELLQDAKKFMIHSKRECLKVNDISNALRLRRTDPLYGYNRVPPITFKTDNKDPDKVILDTNIIRLDDLLKGPIPSYPSEMTFHMHWLEVDGIQPTIPENPSSQLLPSQVNTTTEDKLVSIRPVMFHHLSAELTLYFQKIKEGLYSYDDTVKQTIYNSIRKDQGLHQLLPYLIQYLISEMKSIIKSKRDNMLADMFSLIYVFEALIHNNNINIQLYIHQIIPPVLSCLIAKTLCNSYEEDHWKLREKAASILVTICNVYGLSYPDLQRRLIINLTDILKKPTNIPALYGVIYCIESLGSQVISSILLPLYTKLMTVLDKLIKGDNVVKQYQAQKCYKILNQAVGIYILSQYDLLNGLSGNALIEDVNTNMNKLPASSSIQNLDYIFPYSIQPTSSFYSLTNSLF